MSAPAAAVAPAGTDPTAAPAGAEETAALGFCLSRRDHDARTLLALKSVALSGKSRLARRILAGLACPSGPEALLAPGDLPPTGRLHSASVATLAQVLGTQPLAPWHRERALALYDRMLADGHELVNGEHQGMHAQLLYDAGRTERLREALHEYKNIDRPVRRALEAELEFPTAEADPAEFLLRFQQFAAWADLDLHLRDGDAPFLDRMELHGLALLHGGQKISILMSCFKPGPELITAIRSVIAQSWQNWELLLVDDASGPEYDQILKAAAGLDPRVRLLRQETNGGTYAARNAALKEARGVFVTGLDSDDWAHPRWLEAQVEPMTSNRLILMTYSEGIRATADLHLVLSPGRKLTEIRSTSIMYRRADVLPELGGFDTTRKSADSEFRFRLVRRFGTEATEQVHGRHTIVRQHQASLSKGEIGEGWLSPARFAYESSFRHWHNEIQASGSGAYIDPSAPRRLYAPQRLTEHGAAETRYDLVCAADWRSWTWGAKAMLRAAQAALAEGRTVALAHYARPWEHADVKRPICPEAIDFAREHGLDFVDLATVETDRVLAADAETGAALRYEYPDGIGPLVEAAAGFGGKVGRRPALRPGPSSPRGGGRPWSGRRLLALAVIASLSCLAAVVAGAVIGFPGPAGASVVAAGLSFGTGVAGIAAWKFRAVILRRL